MNLRRESFLLFALNLLDALLTIVWVRNGAAEEANVLMAKLLEMGDLTFLGAKLATGTIVAVVFTFGSSTSFARVGISFALTVYLCLIGVHIVTGLAALDIFSAA